MKKVLLATSALVATTGFAAAQGVSLSGYAEMGIFGGDGLETQFHTDIDATFNMSGTTDNGLTFGASVDLDEVSAATFGSATQGGETIFISGDFGTVTMGDTDGAFDWALQEVGALTSLADDHTTHAGYSGNGGFDGGTVLDPRDGQILRYDNTFGDFGVAVSLELDDSGVFDPTWGIGFTYAAGMFSLGLGYQSFDTLGGDTAIFGVSVGVDAGNGLSGAINYSERDAGTDHMAIGATYTSGDLSLHANYGEYSTGQDGFGLAVNYDLGGGAVVMAGYGSSNGATDTWSLGLGLSF